MTLKGVANQTVLVVFVDVYSAVSTDELPTRFTVQFEVLVVFGAARGDLLRGDQSNQVSLHLLHAYHLMTFELVPLFVHCTTKFTDELGALSTEACGWASGN